MTKDELRQKLSQEPDELATYLKSLPTGVPSWNSLDSQYDPMKHKIMDTAFYPVKINENGIDEFKRTPLGLQKLAVNRLAQSMFSTPSKRTYKYDRNNDSQQKAMAILEELIEVHNYIDSENIERSKKVFASCQMCTIWSVVQEPCVVADEESKFTLRHKTYSPMDGYTLHPILDDYGIVLALVLTYDVEDKNYIDLYVNDLEKSFHTRFLKTENKWEVEARNPLAFFPLVYLSGKEPIWGGDEGTKLVEDLEEMDSFEGLYIKKNAAPTFTLDYGDTQGATKIDAGEKSDDSRRVVRVGKGGSMKAVEWEGGGTRVTGRYARLRNAFFEQIQMPDISFASLITSNTSADNKELMFTDVKAKARDVGGEFERMFLQEIEIIKKFAAAMFPKYAEAFKALSVKSTIVPYSIRSQKETAQYVELLGTNASRMTKIAIIGEVDDVQEELDAIENELRAEANQGIL